MKNATKKAKAGRDVDFKEVRAKESESGGRGSGGELEAKANRRCREVQLQPNTPLPPEPMGGRGAKPASIGFPRQGRDGDSRQVQPSRLLLQCFEVNVAAAAVAWRKVVK